MKEGYVIQSSVFINDKFLYLFNWKYINKVGLFGFRNRLRHKQDDCIGVWKVKQLKN